MAEFSNGTEGMHYETMYCEMCIHYWEEGEGCPIWDAHIIYHGESDKQALLDLLIPMKKDGLSADQCSMFIKK